MPDWPPVVLFLLGAALLPLVPRIVRPGLCVAVPLLALGHLLRLEPGATWTMRFLEFTLVPLEVTRLSLVFGYVFTVMAAIGGVYAWSLRSTGQQAAALLYAGAALGVIFAGDLLTLFFCWELMAVASVCLVWARGTPAAWRAGHRYLYVHLFGGSVLLAGILWHLAAGGTIAFTAFASGGPAWLILAGFALNAAVPPLHAWLSDSYPEATVTGAVFLSAFTTKTAIYALARGFAGWDVLVAAGVVMALYGVVYAVLENDIRRILAYHIISQVGYMVAGVGIGTQMALNGATAHAFTHILYKGLLFMAAGAVLHATGKSRLTELGGLARVLPWTLALYMVGAFSISGFPLFSGFVSKPVTVAAVEYAGRDWMALGLHLASIGTFLHTGLKLPYFTWFGPDRGLRPVAAVPISMYVAMGLAAALNIGIGLFPGVLYALLPFPLEYAPYTAAHLAKTAQLLLFTAAAFWLLRGQLGGQPTIALDTDWLYRRPGRWVGVQLARGVTDVFQAAGRGVAGVVRAVATLGNDPGVVLRGLAPIRPGLPRPRTGSPGIAVGLSVLVVVGCLVVVILGLVAGKQ